MTYLELLRKYKGEIIMASAEELQLAWRLSGRSWGGIGQMILEAKRAYKKEVIESIKKQ